MDVILSLEHTWRSLEAKGYVPIITEKSHVQMDDDGEYKLVCRVVPCAEDNWELDFFPDKTNPYLSPEIKAAREIPTLVHRGSALYGLGVWLKLNKGIEPSTYTAAGSFLKRCLADDPRQRSYVFV